jgi:hypothetical protein
MDYGNMVELDVLPDFLEQKIDFIDEANILDQRNKVEASNTKKNQ